MYLHSTTRCVDLEPSWPKLPWWRLTRRLGFCVRNGKHQASRFMFLITVLPLQSRGFVHLPEFSKKKWNEFKSEQFSKRRSLPKQLRILGTGTWPYDIVVSTVISTLALTDINPNAANASTHALRRLCLNVVDDPIKLQSTGLCWSRRSFHSLIITRHAESTREDIVGDALIKCQDFRTWDPPADLRPSLIITNAPYGERLGNVAELRSLYRYDGQSSSSS